jgi:hypothetical protein
VDAVRAAAGLAPDVLVDPGTWRLVVASMLGRKMVDRIRPVVAQTTGAVPSERSGR